MSDSREVARFRSVSSNMPRALTLCGLTVIAPAAFDPSRSVARLRCNLEHRPATVVVVVVASEIASVVGGPIQVSIAVKHQA